MAYTVKELAQISGISVRTLHWYDAVGLLKPAYHGANGYRYYEEEQLLKLQQILFFRELGFELKQIRKVLGRGDFDKIVALTSHREVLKKNVLRTKKLIKTIDKTIEHLKGTKKMKEKEMFAGFSKEKQAEYDKYLIDSGRHTAEELEAGRKRLEKWQPDDWKKVQVEWEALLKDYVSAIEKGPNSVEARDCVKRHLQYLKKFGIETKKEELVEKASFYLGHPDWKKVFDAHHPKLQEFIMQAIEVFAKSL